MACVDVPCAIVQLGRLGAPPVKTVIWLPIQSIAIYYVGRSIPYKILRSLAIHAKNKQSSHPRRLLVLLCCELCLIEPSVITIF